MKKHTITLMPTEGPFQDLNVWYYPSILVTPEMRDSPETWSEVEIVSVDIDGKELSDEEIDSYGLSGEEWLKETEIHIYL